MCGGMYRGLSEVAGIMGVMRVGLWCPLTVAAMSSIISSVTFKATIMIFSKSITSLGTCILTDKVFHSLFQIIKLSKSSVHYMCHFYSASIDHSWIHYAYASLVGLSC